MRNSEKRAVNLRGYPFLPSLRHPTCHLSYVTHLVRVVAYGNTPSATPTPDNRIMEYKEKAYKALRGHLRHFYLFLLGETANGI